jgi:hypothetical protein
MLAWHHLICEIPPEWEVSRYAVEARVGRLEFATRHGLQALFSWEPCAREPDRRTTMAGFLSANLLGDRRDGPRVAADRLLTADAGPFLLGWHATCPQIQAMAWQPDAKVLLRWIFEQALVDGQPAAWVRPVLTSFRPNEGHWRDYALMGVRGRLPAAFEIEHMAVYPANVMIRFESPRRQAVTFRRWGLPGHIMGGDSLELFYRRVLTANGVAVTASRPARVSGCEALAFDYSARPVHQMERFFGRCWTGGHALVWHDRDDQRIYACEQIAPPSVVPLAWSEILPASAIVSASPSHGSAA